MKTLVIAGTGTWIFGQVAGLPQWADLSSTAAVIVLLGYVICRLIPSMQCKSGTPRRLTIWSMRSAIERIDWLRNGIATGSN